MIASKVNTDEVRCARYLIHRVLLEQLQAGRFVVPGLEEHEQARLERHVRLFAQQATVPLSGRSRRLLGVPEIVKPDPALVKGQP